VNTTDADVIRFLRWYTFVTPEELADLQEATETRPTNARRSGGLAQELTNLVHGRAPRKRSNMPVRPSSGE